MPNHNEQTYVTLLINTPLELRDWSNHVEFDQDRLTELITRILNSPNFKNYLGEEEGCKQILELIKIYDPNILTFTKIDFLLAKGIYSVFDLLLVESMRMEVDNTLWLNVDIRRMSMANIEVELYF